MLLLIESADTTLPYDRGVKPPKYAEAGIREAWIVDLTGESIERHHEPSGSRYRFTAQVGRKESLRSEALTELVLATDAVLG